MKREFHPRKRFHWDFQTRNKHEAHGKQKRRVICREDYTDAIESNEDTDVALPAVLLTAMQVQYNLKVDQKCERMHFMRTVILESTTLRFWLRSEWNTSALRTAYCTVYTV